MSKLYKIWNKRTLYEIYFRPLDDSNVEVITYFSGEPFVNPRSKRKDEIDGNVEVWPIEDARECWGVWVKHGGYEVSEVEDYLQSGRTNSEGESINHRKSINTTKENVTMNGKPCSVSEISKALKGMHTG